MVYDMYLPLVFFQPPIRNGNYGKLEVVSSGRKSLAKFTERCRYGKPKLWLFIKEKTLFKTFFVSYQWKILFGNGDVFKIITSIYKAIKHGEKRTFKTLVVFNIFRVRKWLNVENVRVFFTNFFFTWTCFLACKY